MDKLRGIYLKAKDNKKILKMIAVIMIIIAAVLFFEAKGNSDTISLEEAKKTNTTSGEAQKTETALVYVDIGGEVKSPGVYKVAKNSRIFEVIEKAGGLTKKADTSTINQAESVKDGQKVQIPYGEFPVGFQRVFLADGYTIYTSRREQAAFLFCMVNDLAG